MYKWGIQDLLYSHYSGGVFLCKIIMQEGGLYPWHKDKAAQLRWQSLTHFGWIWEKKKKTTSTSILIFLAEAFKVTWIDRNLICAKKPKQTHGFTHMIRWGWTPSRFLRVCNQFWDIYEQNPRTQLGWGDCAEREHQNRISLFADDVVLVAAWPVTLSSSFQWNAAGVEGIPAPRKDL